MSLSPGDRVVDMTEKGGKSIAVPLNASYEDSRAITIKDKSKKDIVITVAELNIDSRVILTPERGGKPVAICVYSQCPREQLQVIDWRPSGDYIAVANTTGCCVYAVNGTQITYKIKLPETKNKFCRCAEWSSDGDYLAVGIESTIGDTTGTLYVYHFDDVTETFTLCTISGYPLPTLPDSYCYSISWHPSKIAFVATSYEYHDGVKNTYLKIYYLSGTNAFTQGTRKQMVDRLATAVIITPDGNWCAACAVVSATVPELWMYTLNNSGVAFTLNYSHKVNNANEMLWLSTSGNSNFIIGSGTYFFTVTYEDYFKKTGSTWSGISSFIPVEFDGGYGRTSMITYGGDTKVLIFGMKTDLTEPKIYVFAQNPTTGVLTLETDMTSSVTNPEEISTVAWSPDMTKFAVGFGNYSKGRCVQIVSYP